MTKDRKSGPSGSDAPGPDLKSERDQFLRKFTRGSKLTEEFLREVELLQDRLRDLEAENAGLRAKVEADEAIRDLLAKIDRLESEKRELLSRFHRVEAVNSEFTARVQEVESEFANLANLFVASNQLHSSLSPRGVTRRIKEVLAQLVGAERYCMYLANQDSSELIPIAYEGVAGSALTSPGEGRRVGERPRSHRRYGPEAGGDHPAERGRENRRGDRHLLHPGAKKTLRHGGFRAIQATWATCRGSAREREPVRAYGSQAPRTRSIPRPQRLTRPWPNTPA
jgi:predicted nuclease with TOPRIM domain